MAASLAKQIEAARFRVASLECSRRVYAEFPAAQARVDAQLDEAWKALLDLERQAEETRR